MKIQLCGVCEQHHIETSLRAFPGQKINFYTCSVCTAKGIRYCAECEEAKEPEDFPEIEINGTMYRRKLCTKCFEAKEAKKAARKAKKAAKETL